MNVYYRVSTKLQDNKSAIYPDDKYELVKLCHESFLQAKTGQEKVFYLLDSCGWDELFKDHGEIIHYQAGDKDKSVRFMFSFARDLMDDSLFLEDDYLWRPQSLEELYKVLPQLKLISPYDHPSHYFETRFGPFEVEMINGKTYRNCDSNTHTFMCTKEILERNVETMISFGCNDDQMFRSLTDILWCPTVSAATHMVADLMAPNVNWYDIIDSHKS